jgi:hypothetical protein
MRKATCVIISYVISEYAVYLCVIHMIFAGWRDQLIWPDVRLMLVSVLLGTHRMYY